MSKRILLVDDDHATLQIVNAILNMHGYEVISFSDCHDIIEKVELHKPSLVLMDVWLPGPGGEYAAKALKSNPSTSRIPVILFSSEEEILSTALRVGAEGAIVKPFDLIEFASMIEQFLPVEAPQE